MPQSHTPPKAPSLKRSTLWRVMPAMLLTVALLAVVSSMYANRYLRDLVETQHARVASAIADQVSSRLELIREEAAEIARNDLIATGLIDVDARRTYLPQFFRGLELPVAQGASIALTDYRGRVIVKNRAAAYDALQGIKKLLGGSDPLASTAELTTSHLILRVPVELDGRPEGAIVVSYETHRLAKLLRLSEKGAVVLLISPKGRVLLSTDNKAAEFGSFWDFRNSDWIQEQVPIGVLTGVSVVVAESSEQVLHPLHQLGWALGALLLVVLGTVFIAITRAAGVAADSVQTLGQAMAAITDSRDLDRSLPMTGPAEVQELRQRFNEMLAALRATTTSLDLFDNVLSSFNELLLVNDAQGQIMVINPTLRVFLGSVGNTPETPLARLLGVPPGDAFAQVDTQRGDERKVTFAGTNGEERHVTWRRTPLLGPGGVEGAVFVGRDVTEARRAESALLLRDKALSEASNGVVITDALLPDNPVIFVNAAFEHITGYTAQEAIGRNCRFLQGEFRGQPALFTLKKALERREPVGVLLKNVRKNGEPFWNELQVSPVRDDDGRVTHFVGIQNDITERVQHEQALNDREERLRAVLNAAAVAIITIDGVGTVETVNPAAERLFGYRAEELGGQNIKILMTEPNHSAHDGYLARYRETGEQRIIGQMRALEAKRKDGSVVPIELNVTEMHIGDRRMFSGVILDITERAEADKAKKEFIATVSHELRTPLTSIRGSVGMMQSGMLGELPGKVSEMADIIRRNVERLIALVNDLLDIEKLQSGEMAFDMEPVELAELLVQTVETNRPYAAEMSVRFSVAETDPEARVLGDAQRLTQVVANLLSNAAKFTARDTEVEVALRKTPEGYRVTVSDRGPGIPEEFRDKLFQRFAQVDSSDSRKRGGTGLGLNISREIIERHGGQIGFEHREGGGTVFFFVLPALVTAAADRPAEEPAAHAGADRATPLSVLVVEDDADAATVIAGILAGEGCRVTIAHSAAEARQRLEQEHFDVLTVDIGLPDESGLQFLTDLHDFLKQKGITVIVITGSSKHEPENVRALAAVDAWLEKPFMAEQLKTVLGRSKGANQVPRLLCLEDDQDLARVVSSLLGAEFSVSHVRTLAEARERLARERYDAVLLDLGLPDGSGAELLPLLIDEQGNQTPAIIFSASEPDRTIAQQVHASLVKASTSNAQLIATIRRLVKPTPRAQSQPGDDAP